MDRGHQANTTAYDPRIGATPSMPREIMPADGSIAESEGHVAVFCAHCTRWIDCHTDIDPTTALQRHSDLIH